MKSMTTSKQASKALPQSARFIEAAKQAGVDMSGKKFARALKKVVQPRKGVAPPAKR
jgi:hypothetical protein